MAAGYNGCGSQANMQRITTQLGTSQVGAGDPVLFEALITPHRSMGRRGLRWLGGALLLLSGIVAFGVWYLGAWPVLGFSGAEIALVIWLLHRHALGARESEMVMLSDEALRIVRSDSRGRRSEAQLSVGWLRASLEHRPGRTPALMLRGPGQAVEIAASLGEQEKRDLIAALDAALQRQRSPMFNNPQLQNLSPRQGPST